MDSKSETGCCPKFDPSKWDGREIMWDDKMFIKDHVTSVFHIPLNFGSVVKRNMEKIECAGAECKENMMLADENSLWGSDLYIAVDKEIPDANMERISGKYMAKAFEGAYKDAGKWAKEMREYVRFHGKEPKKMFYWYTTCPKCAKVYGKNYTVMLAEI